MQHWLLPSCNSWLSAKMSPNSYQYRIYLVKSDIRTENRTRWFWFFITFDILFSSSSNHLFYRLIFPRSAFLLKIFQDHPHLAALPRHLSHLQDWITGFVCLLTSASLCSVWNPGICSATVTRLIPPVMVARHTSLWFLPPVPAPSYMPHAARPGPAQFYTRPRPTSFMSHTSSEYRGEYSK